MNIIRELMAKHACVESFSPSPGSCQTMRSIFCVSFADEPILKLSKGALRILYFFEA